MKKLNLLFMLTMVAAINAFAQPSCDTCIHAEGVPEITIYEVIGDNGIVLDGLKDDSFVGEGIVLEAIALIDDGDGAPDASIADGYTGKFWMTYDDEAIYGYLEFETSADYEVDQEVNLTYDFEAPDYYTVYGWGGGAIDNNSGLFTKLPLVDALDQEATGIRGTTFFFKETANGYAYEWKTLIFSEVTTDTAIVEAMLVRKSFSFDTFFEIVDYDTDGTTRLKRASLGWADETNNTWQHSKYSGKVKLGGEYVAPSSIFTHVESAVTIYPNPVNNTLNIDNISGKASVYDITGKQMIEDASFNGSLDVSQLNAGIYLIKINDIDGTIKTGKFIK